MALAIPAEKPEDLASSERTYLRLRERVAALKPPCFWPTRPAQPPLNAAERAGLFRLVEAIPGPCGEVEMVAFMQAMRHAPAGDVVEVGAGWGRSASLLVWLAGRYRIGAVLCVDAWSDPPGGAEAAPEPDSSLRIFEMNLAPLAQGRLNYIRAAPAEAAARYRPGLTVATDAFGATTYEGAIAFLHIAGEGGLDAEPWTSKVAPGGWIVFEDGLRPQADAFAEAAGDTIGARFQAGGALFFQLR
ncbi:MAG: hypothetical protein JO127_01455 [Caulobacteraceae bacterium]|nr:hypothetical protein [Caulobacteraceae bacterium]